MKNYRFDDLNDHGVLKPGWLVSISAIVFSRQLFYGPLILILSRRRGKGLDFDWLAVHSLLEFVVCIPALLVLVAIFRRNPGAGANIRRIWQHGRSLLIGGGLLQVFVSAYVAGWVLRGDSQSVAFLIIFQAFLVFFLFRSAYVKDLFSMFPERNDAK